MKLRLAKMFLFVAATLTLLLHTGCGRSPVRRAIEGVQNLQPEADKRNKDIEDLASPSSAKQN
jgi:hypothetical protein